ncbi:sensor histidine kinase [Aeromicrobium sp. 179-A 4D2 NHS]|uniref:ATP-binding protein n=1 Tax=Aeromicrobium sp. 179-A 4D2 NHS TaxID=3142375 RepID=UPI0039A19C76
MLVANLVQNAAVHNHPDGWISVATRTDGGDVVLEVGNTGPAVDDAVVATLTEPFLRAAGRARSGDGSHAGAGLGLAIVASIVRAHGGRLDLSPRRDGGLTVRVRLAAA